MTGYAAPQNKFELKLPLSRDWNHRFFFYACGGFCGAVVPGDCDLGLLRGYASATGNGGHDSARGFDGVWAANAPGLQEDFSWRSNHVLTLLAKDITRQYYGAEIRYSYIAGNSKGGQAVLLEAQRFPQDYDGYLPSAPVYDYTNRNVLAGAWFAQAISDGRGGTVLDAAAAAAVHISVLKQCGAQAGVYDGIVTEPLSCRWRPEMAACAPAATASDCLSQRNSGPCGASWLQRPTPGAPLSMPTPMSPGPRLSGSAGTTSERHARGCRLASPTWSFRRSSCATWPTPRFEPTSTR